MTSALTLGATVTDDGARFVVWAPEAHHSVEVVLDDRRLALAPVGPDDDLDDLWTVQVDGVGHGDRYAYVLDGGEPLPDPASRWQPDGVHDASGVVDTNGFVWTDDDWHGRDLVGAALYELHVGTFTPDGTFDAAIGELPRLAALGVTTIEVMPVNAFPGERNWGYDGVFPFAVQHSYGGPEAFARFVDAAHAHGLAVILDVVYNHVGPEGNYLGRFAPYFQTDALTPWGPALNVAGHRSDGVRRYVLDNVTQWIRDFHLDGFRFDAVHAVVDTTANPLWEQVCRTARRAAGRRRVVLIAESSDNDPRQLDPPDRNGFGFDAVWCDDLHHNLRVAATGDRSGYYVDYDGSPTELADTLRHRWKFRGQYSVARGRSHGRPVDHVAAHRFVVCSQNHDQVGNRPAGKRPDHHVDDARRRAMAATILLSPATPMLFMGEEYGERRPFPFFVDHRDPTILRATNEGRRAEFTDADWSGDIPEPGALETFRSAVLDPTVVRTDQRAARLLAMYTELLRIRREVPPVADPAASQRVELVGDAVLVSRQLDGRTSTLVVHRSDGPASVAVHGELVFASDAVEWGGSAGTVSADGRLTLVGWTVALVVGS